MGASAHNDNLRKWPLSCMDSNIIAAKLDKSSPYNLTIGCTMEDNAVGMDDGESAEDDGAIMEDSGTRTEDNSDSAKQGWSEESKPVRKKTTLDQSK